MDVGHLFWNTDLVAIEVVDLLAAFVVFGWPVVDLRQGVVAVGIGVDIGISAVRVDFLQEVAAVPNKAGLLFKTKVVWKMFFQTTLQSFVGIQSNL